MTHQYVTTPHSRVSSLVEATVKLAICDPVGSLIALIINLRIMAWFSSRDVTEKTTTQSPVTVRKRNNELSI